VLFNALIDLGVPRVPVGRCRRRLLLLAGLARLLPLLDFRQLAPALLDRVLTRGPVGAIMFGAKFTDMSQSTLCSSARIESLLRRRCAVDRFGRVAWRLRYPMRAWMSITGSAFNGATPIAIASATIPSIRPTERFFDGFLLPASPHTTESADRGLAPALSS
jgi:hypothetical protein